MPRSPRTICADVPYHVMNRAHARVTLFESVHDYRLFENLLWDAGKKFRVELMAYCLMPNHWHLVLRPGEPGALSEYMQWLTNTHTHRYHKIKGTTGNGAIYQGRFKAVEIKTEHQLTAAWRYVERNALSANLVARAAEWRWSSLWWRLQRPRDVAGLLAEALYKDERAWAAYVDEPLTAVEHEVAKELTWNH